MRWNWESYLDLARDLAKDADDEALAANSREALLRAAASRAYYAVFHIARDWAEEHTEYARPTRSERGRGSHQHLIDHFERNGANRLEKHISRSLDTARTSRENADYEDAITPPRTWQSVATNAIDAAEEILELLPQAVPKPRNPGRRR